MALAPIDATGADVLVLQSGWSLLFFEVDQTSGILESSEEVGAVGEVGRFTLELYNGEEADNDGFLRATQTFVLRSAAEPTQTLNWRASLNKLVISAAADNDDMVLRLQIVDNPNTPPTSDAVWYGVSYEMSATVGSEIEATKQLRLSEDFVFQVGVADRDTLLSTKYRFRLVTLDHYNDSYSGGGGGSTASNGGLSTLAIVMIVLAILVPLILLGVMLALRQRRKRRQSQMQSYASARSGDE